MLNYVLVANWDFGILELISAISAFLTFSAVVVSLFLALKSKTVRYKIAVNDQSSGLQILNIGDAKFTINCFGINIGKEYFFSDSQKITKMLDTKINTFGNRWSDSETFFNSCTLSTGEMAKMVFDKYDTKSSNSDNIKIKKKVKIFIVINFKIIKKRLNHTKFNISHLFINELSGVNKTNKNGAKYYDRYFVD